MYQYFLIKKPSEQHVDHHIREKQPTSIKIKVTIIHIYMHIVRIPLEVKGQNYIYMHGGGQQYLI